MSKINADHLSKQAYVYIRQSTPDQVQHNLESQRLQYALVDRARELGWPEVTVIDDDQGRSGSGIHRPGFERLLTALCAGIIGAVFCIEASRLARNGRDWHTLLEFCGLVKAVLIDRDSIYDPRLLNDRLLLGMKGHIAEAELSIFRQRSQAALEQKAKRGELFTSVPIGYLRSGDRVEMDPDLRIREVIELVFRKFREFGSVRQVVVWMRQETIELPAVNYGPSCRQIIWKLPLYNSVLRILRNPIYAGAYAYGRTNARTRIENGRKHIVAGNRLEQKDWKVLLEDHHAGYISWPDYQSNQALMKDNANMKGNIVRGSVKHGEGLLAGLLRCGHCSLKLHVAYSGHQSKVVCYHCRQGLDHGGPRCISFGGLRADQLVGEEVLRQLTPFGLQASLEAIERSRVAGDERMRQKELALEQARYETARARRQYDAIEPENRLVVAELERRWNETLRTQSELEAELELLRHSALDDELSPAAREELFKLGQDLPRLWDHPASSPKIKKRILRIVLREIVVSVNDDNICMVLHWQGGDHTELQFKKTRPGHNRWATDVDTIETVRKLARSLPDPSIAALLNRLGKRTAHDLTWTSSRVCSLRNDHQIPVYCEGERQARGELTAQEAAAMLGVSAATILRMIRIKRLPATQSCLGAPWAIRQEDFDAFLVRNLLNEGPQSANSNQLSIDLQ